tara:strand:+ start:434 stop:721 length:288 start_codon:yes stop_codon:yes gene_type:complete
LATVLGILGNIYFIIVPLFYLSILSIVYYFGGKIAGLALSLSYFWIAKWTLFISCLFLSAQYFNEQFLHAMFIFLILNLTINPDFFIKRGNEVIQ